MTCLLKSNRGMDTFPKSSGPFRCLLESGELFAFWLRTPQRERLNMASSGNSATEIGKFILKKQGKSSPTEETGSNPADFPLILKIAGSSVPACLRGINTYNSSHLMWQKKLLYVPTFLDWTGLKRFLLLWVRAHIRQYFSKLENRKEKLLYGTERDENTGLYSSIKNPHDLTEYDVNNQNVNTTIV